MPDAAPVVPKQGVRGLMRAFWVLLAYAFQADPWRASLNLAMTIVDPAAMMVGALASRDLLNAAVARDVDAVWRAALLIGLCAAASIMSGFGSFNLNMVLREKVGELMDRRIMRLTLAVPTLEHHERADYLDEIEILRTQRDQLSSSVQAVVMNISMFARVLGTIGLLSTLHPAMVLLPVFGLPSLFAAATAEQRRQRVLERCAEPLRVTRHLLETATTAAPAKEIRLFGLGGTLRERHRTLWAQSDQIQDQIARQSAVLTTLGWAVFGVGFVGAIAIVANRAINGEANVGDVFLALMLAGQVNELVGGLAQMVTWLFSGLRTTGRYLWLVDYSTVATRPVENETPLPVRLADGIEFDHVTFRYPGTDADVLRDVSFRIPAGATVAIVGDNGAGKSTLVKLLSRFYDPTEGAIRVDGVDLRRLDPTKWRARLSAGFQDFARFELLARETVGVGLLADLDDEDAVRDALVRASAEDVVESLPGGFDSQLGKSFGDGAELSGGQWQKLALGRAMMRRDPLLLLLDEPTAALDAPTEHALFERYAGAARQSAAVTGAVTVLVSHRFSTVRMADLIVVVDGSTVREVGSHADLLAQGGLYAELFELQARAYR
ncbi:MAG TPA: ABC transporter ATP-binding protein [Acidimicrobiales bacterium]|nr:ABC transporter ATP-binding protein [Acidimicrobiales bacterium]